MLPFERERAVAVEAARLAGRVCLAIREEMLHERNHMQKAGREPVTIADYGAQAIILRHIARHFPGDRTLAEERASEFLQLTGEAEREGIRRHLGRALGQEVLVEDLTHWLDSGRERASQRVWVVDPIDGTKGFLRGDQFAVAVALLVEGELAVGALACPLMPYGGQGASDARGSIAAAVRGQGATMEPLAGGPVRPIHVSPRADAAQARVVESVEGAHTNHSFSAQIVEAVGIGGQPVRIDSQAKYAAVADGRAEVYLRRPHEAYREKVWDHAAGVLIVQEAGGRVTDTQGKPVDFTHGAQLEANHGILATNGPLHDQVLDAIRQAG